MVDGIHLGIVGAKADELVGVKLLNGTTQVLRKSSKSSLLEDLFCLVVSVSLLSPAFPQQDTHIPWLYLNSEEYRRSATRNSATRNLVCLVSLKRTSAGSPASASRRRRERITETAFPFAMLFRLGSVRRFWMGSCRARPRRCQSEARVVSPLRGRCKARRGPSGTPAGDRQLSCPR